MNSAKLSLLQELQSELPRAKRLMHERQTNLLKEYSLTRSQFEVFLFLYHQGHKDETSWTTKELASELLLTKGAISVLIDQLVGLGYVSRSEDPADRRIIKLGLTAKGKKIGQKVIVNKEVLMADIMSKLSTDELKTLIKFQRTMIDKLKNLS